MKLYTVTFFSDGTCYTEPHLADDFDHAEEQCREQNPEDIEVINVSRIPYYMVERAYYLGKPKK
jgi:hypothetical protein